MKRFRMASLLLAGALSLPAAAYDVDLKKDMNGMKVSAEASGGPMARLIINNSDKVPVQCRGEFISGRGAPTVRTTSVRPGKRAILTAPVPEGTTMLRVNAVCKPPKSKADKTE